MTKEPSEFQIAAVPAKELRCAMMFASTDETRYVLNGVHIEPGKVIATDGRRMCVINSGGNIEAEANIPTEALKAVLPGVKGDTLIIVERREGRVSLSIESRTLREVVEFNEFEAGKYPNWVQVVPSDSETPTDRKPFAINSELFSAFLKVRKILYPTTEPGMVVNYTSRGSAIEFSCGLFYGLLMQMRSSDGEAEFIRPSWLVKSTAKATPETADA